MEHIEEVSGLTNRIICSQFVPGARAWIGLCYIALFRDSGEECQNASARHSFKLGRGPQ